MAMEYMLRDIGRSCVSLSIDDFYLTGAELESLASHNPDNFILQSRGNGGTILCCCELLLCTDIGVVFSCYSAGTHDLELFHHTINSLLSFGDAVSSGAALDLVVRVPRFDKSLRGGKGDRAPEDKWTVVTGSAPYRLYSPLSALASQVSN
jgi:D-glycerate 3-kinase